MKIRGKRRGSASVIARRWRRSGSTIEISTSRWSPIINRIVSDPPGQPPANRYLDRSKTAPHANSGRIMERKGSLALPVAPSPLPTPPHLPLAFFFLGSLPMSASRTQRGLFSAGYNVTARIPSISFHFRFRTRRN